MPCFSFRSVLKGGKQDKEAPDEAFLGKISQHSPSLLQSYGAVSKRHWNPVVVDLLQKVVEAFSGACCRSM